MKRITKKSEKPYNTIQSHDVQLEKAKIQDTKTLLPHSDVRWAASEMTKVPKQTEKNNTGRTESKSSNNNLSYTIYLIYSMLSLCYKHNTVQEWLWGSGPEGLTSEAHEQAHIACSCANEFELQGWVSHGLSHRHS